MTELQTVPAQVPRDRWGRPLVVPPEGGKPVPYTRCTTYVKCLEDTYNLERWKMRMTALGLALRHQDLVASVLAHQDDKDKLNEIAEQAMEVAKAGASANIGTALHVFTQRLDAGQPLGVIPDIHKADLAAYEKATACLEVVDVEQFTVLDHLRIGGTYDRLVKFHGEHFIADVKTGDVKFGVGTIAMQLAVYAHSVRYDPATHARTPLPDVNQDRAIVIHLPAGKGECTLKWVNIRAGWEAVELATKVREWRGRKDLASDFQPVDDGPTPAPSFDLDNAIATAQSVEALNALWAEHYHHWTPAHTGLAAARKKLLLNGSVGGETESTRMRKRESHG